MILLSVMAETVVILGASNNPERYAYKAQLVLMEKGHVPVPVNPRYDQVDGIQCYPELKSLECDIDTITIYVKPAILRSMAEDIINARPGRVIFNPGAESRALADILIANDIEVVEACTLVMLTLNQY